MANSDWYNSTTEPEVTVPAGPVAGMNLEAGDAIVLAADGKYYPESCMRGAEYAILRKDDKLQEGDEYQIPSSQAWMSTQQVGCTIGAGGVYRRPIVPLTPTEPEYRMLERGEIVIRGDEVRHDDRWVTTIYSYEDLYGLPAHHVGNYRRKVTKEKT